MPCLRETSRCGFHSRGSTSARRSRRGSRRWCRWPSPGRRGSVRTSVATCPDVGAYSDSLMVSWSSRAGALRHGFALCAAVLCTGCAIPTPPAQRVPGPPVRFLLTFDDGPSTREPYNPTRAVLDQLANNPVQRDVKAGFCVRTRDTRAGAAAAGLALMERGHAEGHVLALHTSTPSHRSHLRMSDAALTASLLDGVADLYGVTGRAPT